MAGESDNCERRPYARRFAKRFCVVVLNLAMQSRRASRLKVPGRPAAILLMMIHALLLVVDQSGARSSAMYGSIVTTAWRARLRGAHAARFGAAACGYFAFGLGGGIPRSSAHFEASLR